MKKVDISGSPRLPVLMEMVDSLSRLTDPGQVLETFIGAMRRVFGPSGRCFMQISTRGLARGQYRIQRIRIFEGGSTIAADPAPAAAEGLPPVQSGGLLGPLLRSPTPKIFHEVDLSADPVLGHLVGFRSLMMAPVFAEGEAAEWVCLFDREPAAFSIDDLEEMILRANLVGATVNNLHIARELFSANLRIQQEIEQIANIQRALLPEQLPQPPGLRLAASYETFAQAGGDLYDVALAPGVLDPADGPWMLLIGDVSGHGPAAAVVMAMLNTMLRTYPSRPGGPAELLDHVNRHLCAKCIGHSFVTAFLAFYWPGTRRLCWARAGHNPPLLIHRGGGQWRALVEEGGVPLGLEHGIRYSQSETVLNVGDTLVLYTDGVSEAADPQREWFDMKGIVTAAGGGGAAELILGQIQASLRAHESGTPPHDDQTLLVVEVI